MQMCHDEISVVDLPVERHNGQHDTSQPARDEDRKRPGDPQHRQRHLNPPDHQSCDKGEKLDAGRYHHRLGCGGKEAQ